MSNWQMEWFGGSKMGSLTCLAGHCQLGVLHVASLAQRSQGNYASYLEAGKCSKRTRQKLCGLSAVSLASHTHHFGHMLFITRKSLGSPDSRETPPPDGG